MNASDSIVLNNVNSQINRGNLTIRVSGRLASGMSSEGRQALKELVEGNGARLIVDA